MFEIALTVLSCLKAGTRADVAWVADYEGPEIAGKNGAIAITPGGGKMGSVLSNARFKALSQRCLKFNKCDAPCATHRM